MPELIEGPSLVPGVEPKVIEEYVGGVNTGSTDVSVARMVAPGGWSEPGQRPDFAEVTLVLAGTVRVEHEGGVIDVSAGQALTAAPGEWVRYSTPNAEGATYVSVCTPAFSPEAVNRDVD